jgi:hypothetical protein
MDLQEKILYHQIHPLKLTVDWGTGILALVPFWQHNLLAALLIAFIPSILVSIILVRFVDLEKYRQSSFGKYIRRYMTRPVELVRFVGYAAMAVGAWFHLAWLIPLGLIVILFAWLRGIIFPAKP